MDAKSLSIVLFVALVCVAGAEEPRSPLELGDGRAHHTIYKTITSSTTVTSTSTVKNLCAVLVNVTAACRRRRGMWIDEPEVLSFDDNMDIVDLMLNPSETYRMEATVLVDDVMPADPKMAALVTSAVIESSSGELPPEAQFTASEKKFFNNFNPLLLPEGTKKKCTTVTLLYLQTITSTSLTTTSKTFFVQGCTPSPFPFALC